MQWAAPEAGHRGTSARRAQESLPARRPRRGPPHKVCTFLLQASQAAKKIADATGKDLIGGLQWHRSLLADVEGTSEPAAPTQVRDVFFFFFGGGGRVSTWSLWSRGAEAEAFPAAAGTEVGDAVAAFSRAGHSVQLWCLCTEVLRARWVLLGVAVIVKSSHALQVRAVVAG